jgi:hypothetical protein
MAASALVPVGFVLASPGPRVSSSIRLRLQEVSRPPRLYLLWHQRKTAADRLSVADLSLIGPQLSSQSLVGAP